MDFKKIILTLCFSLVFIFANIQVSTFDLSYLLEKTYSIEVKGAVEEPGIYEVTRSDTVLDVIELAGLLEESDTSSLNLSQNLYPHQVIVVASKEETSSLISINSASLEELDTLPGIGPTIAQRIIDYRSTNNGFKTLEELMEVSGIGEKIYAGLEDLITL